MSTKADLESDIELEQADFLFNGLATDAKVDSRPLQDDAPVPKAHVPGNDINQTLLNVPDLDTTSMLKVHLLPLSLHVMTQCLMTR